MTTTTTELRQSFARYVKWCDRYGLIPKGYRVVLDEGSKLYGRAYRIALTGERAPDGTWPNGTGHGRPPVGDDYLGMTKDEARRTLDAYTSAIIDLGQAFQLLNATPVTR
jgi:hypothetical protein